MIEFQCDSISTSLNTSKRALSDSNDLLTSETNEELLKLCRGSPALLRLNNEVSMSKMVEVKYSPSYLSALSYPQAMRDGRAHRCPQHFRVVDPKR